jgi:hypothetical protein
LAEGRDLIEDLGFGGGREKAEEAQEFKLTES